jgi:hypothetical protein
LKSGSSDKKGICGEMVLVSKRESVVIRFWCQGGNLSWSSYYIKQGLRRNREEVFAALSPDLSARRRVMRGDGRERIWCYETFISRSRYPLEDVTA